MMEEGPFTVKYVAETLVPTREPELTTISVIVLDCANTASPSNTDKEATPGNGQKINKINKIKKQKTLHLLPSSSPFTRLLG